MLKTTKKEKNVNTKFDKSMTLGKLLCVTPLNKNKDLKAKMVSKVEVKTDKSKSVTSCSTPKNEQGQKKNVNSALEMITSQQSLDMEIIVQGNLMICHVYYVEGLGHNLFPVGQFCDGDLKVAFGSNTCYVWNLEGEDLLTGSHNFNLYTISISEMELILVC
ncbi:hypothetical protein Tco_0278003 [Tanacetum coccineum]